MRKILIFIIIVFVVAIAFIQCPRNPFAEKHKMTKEITIEYSDSDSMFWEGVYKEVFRRYNYVYKDSFAHKSDSIGKYRIGEVYTNEYGDTVYIRYIDWVPLMMMMDRKLGVDYSNRKE